MKAFLVIILIVVLCACQSKPKAIEKASVNLAKKPTNKTGLSTTKDTLFNYWPISNDTVRFRKKVILNNKEGLLFIKKFSLNDSSVINTGVGDKNIFIDFSHANVIDLELFIDTINVRKRINKEVFKTNFESNDFKKINLMSINVDSVSNNIFYLTSDLGIPDSDIIWEKKYSIKLMNKNFGSIRIIK